MSLRISLLFLIACQGNEPAKQPPPPPAKTQTPTPAPAATGGCDAVGDGIRAVWDKQAADATDDATRVKAKEFGDKAVNRLVRHCKDDHWSADVIACVRAGGATCTARMTPEQAGNLATDKLDDAK